MVSRPYRFNPFDKDPKSVVTIHASAVAAKNLKNAAIMSENKAINMIPISWHVTGCMAGNAGNRGVLIFQLTSVV
jgi:hypothetical protein